MGIMKTLTINGVKYDVTPVVPATSVTLLANAWVGSGCTYSQVVAVPGATPNTKVDLQPTAEQLEEFHYKILSFVAENEGGVVTVYCIGDKPKGDHTIQTTLTEVEASGKIRGNTVGTSMPKPDWNQTDPTKADYILNKPVVVKTVNGVAPDENGDVVVEVPEGGGGSGEPGADGFSPVATVTQTDSGVVISVTDKYGTTTATVTNGKDGADGKDGSNGKDGVSATHSWNGTTLTITSASGTSSADLKGEKGDKGDQGIQGEKGETGAAGSNGTNGKDGANGTSVTVKSVSESTADGGSNVVTFSDGKTLTVKNGKTGAAGKDGNDGLPGDPGADGNDGYTPVRGVDYWTTADKAEIEAHIAAELAKRGQLEPLYANSVEECTDTTKMYVLPDGFIYAYMLTEKEVESGGGYTNVLPSATDTDRKTIYNGKGYSEGGKRLSSSGSESTTAVTNNAVTGFISAKVGDIVRIKGFWCPSGVSDYLISYNSSNAKVNYKTFNSVSGESSWGPGSQTWYTVADGVTTIQLTEANFDTGFDAIRFSGVITADTIVTINQEIKEGGGTTIVKEYAWTSTGHAFVPADYEDRIVALENDVANLKANGVDSGGVDASRVSALEVKTARHDTKIANLETLTSQHSSDIAALKQAVENGASGGGTSGGSSGNTNLLPTAVDTDGSIYNGIGYKPSTRLSGSSGLPSSSQEAMCTSGFMPASDGNVVKIKGSSPVSGVSAYLITYNSSKSIIKYQAFSIGSTDWSTANQNWYTYADGVLTIQLTEANFGTDIAFFRFNAHMDENTVVTVSVPGGAGGSDNTANLTPEEALALIRNWDSPIYDRVPVFQLPAENPAVPSSERTVPSIYAKYDALVAAHPNYITKKDLGVCSDGVTHVYRYDFCEPEPHHQSGQQWSETKPVIICASGIHWEWAGVYSLYFALKAITENAELDDLRRNVHFVVVPIINPYCFTDIGPYNQTYGVLNANGVQIHRNFEVGFKYPGTSGHVALGDRNHGGTEPVSEIETKNIDNIFKEFPDAALFMTCHSAQRDTRWGTGFIWASTATNYTCNLGYRLVDKMSKAWHKKYGTTWEEGCVRENEFVLADTATYPHATPLADGDYRAGHAHVSATDGTETRQATKYGIQGANVEVLEAFWVLDDTILGSKVTTHGAEVYINYLLMYMGCYDHKDKKQYYIK